MELNDGRQKVKGWIYKFRYPILVILAGIILLTLPGKTKISLSTSTSTATPTQKQVSAADELTQILQQIRGVGRVQVLLTVSKSERKEYQSDEDHTTNESGNDIRKETVIVRDADDNEMALITQIISPEYLGAIVVCEGADDPNVKLAVLEAVAKATGLRSDSISVLKMK